VLDELILEEGAKIQTETFLSKLDAREDKTISQIPFSHQDQIKNLKKRCRFEASLIDYRLKRIAAMVPVVNWMAPKPRYCAIQQRDK
jgi:hypothetical protein